MGGYSTPGGLVGMSMCVYGWVCRWVAIVGRVVWLVCGWVCKWVAMVGQVVWWVCG